jgi:hypothetical protein
MMRLHGGLPLLAAVVLALVVSGCGSSSSNPTSNGAPVNSSAIRSELEKSIVSSGTVKAPEATKIVNCIIAKMNADGITTNGEAESHQSQVTQFSETCTEKVLGAGG